MAPRPFESRIQDLVYNVDVGIGLRLIKIGLYVLFVGLIMVLYTGFRFAHRGFDTAEAMEYAQVARNFAEHGRLQTQCVRPLSMWYLIEHSEAGSPQLEKHPDIVHPPLYPVIMGTAFKVAGTSFEAGQRDRIYKPERIIVAVSHLSTVLTGILVFLLGMQLFDRRIALLSATLFYLSDSVWHFSISGLSISLAVLWTTAAFYCAVLAAAKKEDADNPRSWIPPMALSLVFCVLAFLTRYGTIVALPAVILITTLPLRKGWWKWALALLLAFIVIVSPWFFRNKAVSGGFTGLALYSALEDSTIFPDDRLPRSLAPTFQVTTVKNTLKVKWLSNLKTFYTQDVLTMGDGILVCLFVTTFFYRFVRQRVHVFRWCIALSLILLLLVAPLFGETTLRLMHMFWPIVIIYGLAFFFLLLDRLQLGVRVLNMAVIGVMIGLTALPLIFSLMPPRVGAPYPPYFPPHIRNVSSLLEPDELMCSDMPWATAWHGNRTSILLPLSIDDFYEINDYFMRISGLYFTTLTRDQGYARSLLTGSERTWFPILEGKIPGDFPLTQGFPLNNMDQLFLTDRARWLEE